MVNWLYRTFTSLKTSVYLMGALTFFYVLGTVFPQAVKFERYKEAGGRYLFLVKTFGLLHVFSSPLFLFLSLLLLVNLGLCIYVRIKAYLDRSLRLPEAQLIGSAQYCLEEDEKEDVSEFFRRKGFRSIYKDQGQEVLQKGVPLWWASWVFHIGMGLAIIGFFITFVSAHESEITLYPDKPVEFSLYSPETRWNRLLKGLGLSVPEKRPEETYRIGLREFKTTYQEKLSLQYPREAPERLALGLGLTKLRAREEPEPYPLQYETSFVIEMPDGTKKEASLQVNHPYRQGPLTLYQMGYEQKITLQVDGKEMEVEPYKPFRVQGMDDRFILSDIRWGKMKKRDGSEVDLIPQAYLYRIGPDGRKRLAILKKGQWQAVEGRRWRIKDFEEASVLSYRVDRGVALIKVAVTIAMVALFLRVYGRFYRLRVLRKDGRLYIHIQAGGLLADERGLMEELIRDRAR